MDNPNSAGLTAPEPMPTNIPIKGKISVIDAIGPALNHMTKVLFKSFNIVKWLKFGLVAFLVALGSGGGGGFNFNTNFNIPVGDTGSKDFSFEKTEPIFEPILEWATTHMTLLIILIVAAVLIISIIWMVVIYFSSRFSFVYLDGVIKNDMQIKKAYKENRITGWSYFLWRIIFWPTVLLVIMLFLALVGLGIYLLATAYGFTTVVIILTILIGLIALLVFIALIIFGSVITTFIDDFVVPIMYLKKLRVLQAWKVFRGLLRFNKTHFFLYVIFKILLALASVIVIILPCCCFGAICMPFGLLMVGLVVLAFKFSIIWVAVVLMGLVAWFIISVLWQTIVSPVTVFFRTYPLVFLEGFGKEFASITPQPIQVPAGCEYVS
ncbi:hypothetical protein ACFL5I_00090 [Planctomycetota bacterium]